MKHSIRKIMMVVVLFFLSGTSGYLTIAEAKSSDLFMMLAGVWGASADSVGIEYIYQIIDTGQETCYDLEDEISCPASGEMYSGQDAQFSGLPFSLSNNGDGTIKDLNSELIWQQVPPSTGYSWQQAVDYCDSLVLAGNDDWRIPSLKELFSISDFSQGWPYIDTNYFTLASGSITKDEQYWTSNFYHVGTTHNGAESAFGVNHVTGHIKAYPAGAGGPFGNYIRCVRGDSYGVNDFVDNNDGTITDKATGLMWTQNDSEEALDWPTALQSAETLSYAGYDDWRLPSVKELQSIVDYSGVFPAIDPLFSCTSINNEAGDTDYGYYWTNTSALFQENGSYYYAWYVAFGRAVDGDGEDTHGAGAVRFDTKVEGGPLGEGGERYYNYVRYVRDLR